MNVHFLRYFPWISTKNSVPKKFSPTKKFLIEKWIRCLSTRSRQVLSSFWAKTWDLGRMTKIDKNSNFVWNLMPKDQNRVWNRVLGVFGESFWRDCGKICIYQYLVYETDQKSKNFKRKDLKKHKKHTQKLALLLRNVI